MPGIMLVHDDAVRSLEIQQAIHTLADYELVNHVKSRGECVLLLPKNKADIIMIRPRLADGSGVELALQIRQARPGSHVVLTLDGDESSEIWTDILKHGFRAVLSPPFTALSLTQAFDDLHLPVETDNRHAVAASSAASAGKAFVIAVASARGGSGRTLVAVNLALAAAQRGKRVVLLDFTGHPSDFSMMLDDIPRNTLEDIIGASGAMDGELVESVMAVHPKGIRYLSSPSHDFDMRGFTRAFAGEMLALVRESADVVIVDTGDVAVGPSEAAFAVADTILVIATRDVIRLDATRRFLSRLAESGMPPETLKVIVNQNELGSEVSDREIETIIEHPVDGYLPNDPEAVPFSINSGKAMVLHEPKRPFSVVMGKLADLAVNRWNDSASVKGGAADAGQKRGGLSSLFRRS